MPTGRLILLLLLIVLAAVAIVLLLRRGAAQRDEQRVEAAGIRGEAEGIAATMTGQDTFAQQAEERAEVARIQAEQRARKAARLEAEAAEQRAAAEATRREYEETMRRADDIDPDVKESAFAPVAEPAQTTATDAAPDAGDVAPDAGAAATSDVARDVAPDAGDDAVPLSRAERREAREGDEGGSSGTAPSGPGAAAAGAAAVGAVGASSWGRRDEDATPESARIASAADYRDEVPAGDADAGASSGVYEPVATGSGAAMTQEPRQDDDTVATADLAHDTESPRGEWGGPRTDVDAPAAQAGTPDRAADDSAGDETPGEDASGDTVIVSDTDSFASTEPLPADEQTPPIEPVAPESTGTADDDRTTREHTTDETAADREETAEGRVSASGSGDDADRPAAEGAGDVQIVSDTDAYASTEPLTASETEPAPDVTEDADAGHDGAPDVSDRSDAAASDRSDAAESDSHADRAPADADHAPAEAGAAVAEPSEADTERSASDVAAEPAEERYDPTPSRDWAADEGDLLAENRELGDRLADDRQDLEAEGDRLTGVAAREGASASERDVTASDTAGTASDTDATASDSAGTAGTTSVDEEDDSVDQAVGRRVSDFDELRDGGYGVGSAAPLGDGAQPLDHPVQGYRDTMTFRSPGDTGYDSAEPDVWFYDEAAAERNGFRRSDG